MKMKFVKKIFSILVLVFSFITITYAEEIKNYDVTSTIEKAMTNKVFMN